MAASKDEPDEYKASFVRSLLRSFMLIPDYVHVSALHAGLEVISSLEPLREMEAESLPYSTGANDPMEPSTQ